MKNAIGFLPEMVSFQGDMSGRQVLGFYAKLKRTPSRQCAELLELVGLSQAANARVKTYSKGMRQRLGLAQALLGEPQILLLDEPTTGLDPFLRKLFYQIIQEYKLRGTAVLIASHALSEIEGHVDRILIMQDGQALIQGTVGQLREAAGLPIQIRVIPRPGLEQTLIKLLDPLPYRINGKSRPEWSTFECTQTEKIALVAQIMQHHRYIKDVEVFPPQLDDLYTYFVEKANRI